MRTIDFWLSSGSTYSYLTVMRLAEIEIEAGVSFHCPPFNARRLMVEQNNIPFKERP